MPPDAAPDHDAPFDLVVRGGTVVDGTGLPPYRADVAVRDGRIAKVGRIDDAEAGRAHRVLDATGLHVTPGFVDIHTHYDAQLMFEPTCSPASWHGVTTVLTGNCGFTIAPARDGDVGWLCQMLSRVEGMPAESLAAGVTYTGGSFGDFLDELDGVVGLNVAGYVGHSAVRRVVMGSAAQERAATDDEIAAMAELVRQAMLDGAIGFSTSQIEVHQAHDGRPVPSNLAAPEEVAALAAALCEFDHGVIEIIPRSFAEGYDEADRDLLREIARRSGKPVHLNTLVHFPAQPDGWRRSLEFAEEAQREGLRLYPMYAAHRGGAYFALHDTFLLDDVPAFHRALVLPEAERTAALRDPAVRDQIRHDLVDPGPRSFPLVYDLITVDSVHRPELADRKGRNLGEMIRERGGDELDAFLDICLEDDLRTIFFLTPLSARGGRAVTEALVRHPLVTAGSSDGGAHLASFVGADYTTRLVSEWVPGVLSLEEAVRQLTAIPAALNGLSDRGEIRPGAWADLVVFDRERLGVGETRFVDDFPAGAGRLVVDATGYVAVIVNGEVVLAHGIATGARPGHVLRGGTYRDDPAAASEGVIR
jgi:N-acyl-D-aspartate/D-glutamate deacylase